MCNPLYVTKQQDTFPDALVAEIRAEMGRRGVTSVRALAELIDMNHVSLNDRLGPKRVPITVKQLFAIANALEVEPAELIARATPTPPVPKTG